MDRYTRTAKESNRAEVCELTTVCLIRDGDRYLLQNRVKEDWLGYALPGGHVEPGESITASVIREMKEETGLDITNPKLKGIKQFKTGFGRYMVFIFLATDFTGEIKASEEGKVEWVESKNISNLNTVPNLDRVIEIATLDDGYAHEMSYNLLNDTEDIYEIIIN